MCFLDQVRPLHVKRQDRAAAMRSPAVADPNHVHAHALLPRSD
jgi:hypothetical protein